MARERYNLEQRVFIYDCNVKTNSYKSCRRKFLSKFTTNLWEITKHEPINAYIRKRTHLKKTRRINRESSTRLGSTRCTKMWETKEDMEKICTRGNMRKRKTWREVNSKRENKMEKISHQLHAPKAATGDDG
jgi:hypothetical protein